jgi:hypothetical protein
MHELEAVFLSGKQLDELGRVRMRQAYRVRINELVIETLLE